MTHNWDTLLGALLRMHYWQASLSTNTLKDTIAYWDKLLGRTIEDALQDALLGHAIEDAILRLQYLGRIIGDHF